MTKFRKTVLSLSVLAAVGGAVSSVQAVNLASDGLGDVLLFPYYTTRNEWQTLIHLVNTSFTHTVVAKVRFQEAQNTRDVLDFNVVMSPNDVWTGWIEDDVSGTPYLHSTDSTCTSPNLHDVVKFPNGFPFSSVAYGGGSLERAKEGHITVIEMGASNNTGLTSINAAAKAKNCTAVDNGFSPFVNSAEVIPINTTSDEFGEPLNVLKGSFAMIRLEKGLSVGGSPTTLANFFTPCSAGGTVCTVNNAASGQNVDGAKTASRNGGVAANFGITNLIVAQQYPDFLLPTLGDANPRVSMIQDDTTLKLQTPRVDIWANGVDAVSAVLMRSNVINEWSSNLTNGAETYWVVSFPTKLHYVDENAQPTPEEITGMLVPVDPANVQPTFIGTRATTNPVAAAKPAAPFTKIWTDTTFSCDTVTFNLWDRSEGGTTTGGTSISPAPPTPATSICYEVNVLAFNTTGTDPVFSSNVAKTINTSTLVSKEPYGWMNMALPTNPVNTIAGTSTTPLGAANTYAGLPVIGYTIWSRSFSPTDKTKNYGHLVDHSFKRAVTPP